MAETLISTHCWKSFPTGLLKMEEVQDSRHFQMSKAISADMKAAPAGGHRGSSFPAESVARLPSRASRIRDHAGKLEAFQTFAPAS
jgi:hypothetical protein